MLQENEILVLDHRGEVLLIYIRRRSRRKYAADLRLVTMVVVNRGVQVPPLTTNVEPVFAVRRSECMDVSK